MTSTVEETQILSSTQSVAETQPQEQSENKTSSSIKEFKSVKTITTTYTTESAPNVPNSDELRVSDFCLRLTRSSETSKPPSSSNGEVTNGSNGNGNGNGVHHSPVKEKEDSRSFYPLCIGLNRIGRAELNNICVLHPLVSKRQACIQIKKENDDNSFSCQIWDCGSTNKTKLGDRVLDADDTKEELKKGDRISFGRGGDDQKLVFFFTFDKLTESEKTKLNKIDQLSVHIDLTDEIVDGESNKQNGKADIPNTLVDEEEDDEASKPKADHLKLQAADTDIEDGDQKEDDDANGSNETTSGEKTGNTSADFHLEMSASILCTTGNQSTFSRKSVIPDTLVDEVDDEEEGDKEKEKKEKEKNRKTTSNGSSAGFEVVEEIKTKSVDKPATEVTPLAFSEAQPKSIEDDSLPQTESQTSLKLEDLNSKDATIKKSESLEKEKKVDETEQVESSEEESLPQKQTSDHDDKNEKDENGDEEDKESDDSDRLCVIEVGSEHDSDPPAPAVVATEPEESTKEEEKKELIEKEKKTEEPELTKNDNESVKDQCKEKGKIDDKEPKSAAVEVTEEKKEQVKETVAFVVLDSSPAVKITAKKENEEKIVTPTLTVSAEKKEKKIAAVADVDGPLSDKDKKEKEVEEEKKISVASSRKESEAESSTTKPTEPAPPKKTEEEAEPEASTSRLTRRRSTRVLVPVPVPASSPVVPVTKKTKQKKEDETKEKEEKKETVAEKKQISSTVKKEEEKKEEKRVEKKEEEEGVNPKAVVGKRRSRSAVVVKAKSQEEIKAPEEETTKSETNETKTEEKKGEEKAATKKGKLPPVASKRSRSKAEVVEEKKEKKEEPEPEEEEANQKEKEKEEVEEKKAPVRGGGVSRRASMRIKSNVESANEIREKMAKVRAEQQKQAAADREARRLKKQADAERLAAELEKKKETEAEAKAAKKKAEAEAVKAESTLPPKKRGRQPKIVAAPQAPEAEKKSEANNKRGGLRRKTIAIVLPSSVSNNSKRGPKASASAAAVQEEDEEKEKEKAAEPKKRKYTKKGGKTADTFNYDEDKTPTKKGRKSKKQKKQEQEEQVEADNESEVDEEENNLNDKSLPFTSKLFFHSSKRRQTLPPNHQSEKPDQTQQSPANKQSKKQSKKAAADKLSKSMVVSMVNESDEPGPKSKKSRKSLAASTKANAVVENSSTADRYSYSSMFNNNKLSAQKGTSSTPTTTKKTPKKDNNNSSASPVKKFKLHQAKSSSESSSSSESEQEESEKLDDENEAKKLKITFKASTISAKQLLLENSITTEPHTKKKDGEKVATDISSAAKIMATGLVLSERQKKIIKTLGGEIVLHDASECTHLITNKVRKTCKFLSCLNKGASIVSDKWLDECSKMKSFDAVKSDLFALVDSQSEKQYKFSLKTSLIKAKSASLFDGWQFVLIHQDSPQQELSRDDLKSIIECGKGQVIENLPAETKSEELARCCVLYTDLEKYEKSGEAEAKSADVLKMTLDTFVASVLKQSFDILHKIE